MEQAPSTHAIRIHFVDPTSGEPLRASHDKLFNSITNAPVADVVDGIPRFVKQDENYAEAFGFQWNTWRTLSDGLHGGRGKWDEVVARTRFDEYTTDGASILECGMGGGDDTEVLLQFPFQEVHSFDLSNAVDRAAKTISDPRLRISQASIYSIPYPDASFDFVFCHRVLQHTPDPQQALRCICRKVKPGGILFAHCYKRSWMHMNCFKYKVRWLTRRLPYSWIYWYVRKCGPVLHHVNRALHRLGVVGKRISHDFVPFYHYPTFLDLSPERLREFEQLNTFDALTPAYDNPMTTKAFTSTILDEGFVIEHLSDPPYSPIYCTAVKRTDDAPTVAV